MARLRTGARVRHADASERSIPAYRDMRGTVVGFDWTYVLVQWDCDSAASRVLPEWLALAEDEVQP